MVTYNEQHYKLEVRCIKTGSCSFQPIYHNYRDVNIERKDQHFQQFFCTSLTTTLPFDITSSHISHTFKCQPAHFLQPKRPIPKQKARGESIHKTLSRMPIHACIIDIRSHKAHTHDTQYPSQKKEMKIFLIDAPVLVR